MHRKAHSSRRSRTGCQMACRLSGSRHRSSSLRADQKGSQKRGRPRWYPSMSVRHRAELVGMTGTDKLGSCFRQNKLTGGPSFCSTSDTYSGPVCPSCPFPVDWSGRADKLANTPAFRAPITRDPGVGGFCRGRMEVGRIPPRKCRGGTGRWTGDVGTMPLVLPGAGWLEE